MEKNKLGLGILIGILSTLVIVMGVFIVYDKVLSDDKNDNGQIENNNNEQTENNNTEEKDIIQNLATDDTTATTLYEKISFYICSPGRDYYYRNAKTLVSNMNNDVKINLAAKNTTKRTVDQETLGILIEESDLKQTYTELFGKNINYIYSDVTEIASIKKRADGKILYREADVCWSELEKKVTKIEKNVTKDEIYLYEKVVFFSLESYDDVVNVYSDYQKTNKLASSITVNRDNVISEYSDKLDTYKYIFKTNGDGTYYFYGVEKVK